MNIENRRLRMSRLWSKQRMALSGDKVINSLYDILDTANIPQSVDFDSEISRNEVGSFIKKDKILCCLFKPKVDVQEWRQLHYKMLMQAQEKKATKCLVVYSGINVTVLTGQSFVSKEILPKYVEIAKGEKVYYALVLALGIFTGFTTRYFFDKQLNGIEQKLFRDKERALEWLKSKG